MKSFANVKWALVGKKKYHRNLAESFIADSYLIVDGYNVIGATGELSEMARKDFDAARDLLIDWLADYQGHANQQVIVVFDAHYVKGIGGRYDSAKVEVRFTRENESADEFIERLISEMYAAPNKPFKVEVATSDQTEQNIIFGVGGLRLPAWELVERIRLAKGQARKQIQNQQPSRKRVDERIDQHIFEKLDQMRKGYGKKEDI